MNSAARCLRLEAVATIDRKGQVVIPKHLRDESRIKPRDKLIIMVYESKEGVCCIVLLKAEELAEIATRMITSVFDEAV